MEARYIKEKYIDPPNTTDFGIMFLPVEGLAVIYFFFLLGMQPIENTLVANFTPRRFHHSAYGIKFVLTFGVGALAVKMAAFIETTAGIGAIFPALGFTSFILVAVIVLLIFKFLK